MPTGLQWKKGWALVAHGLVKYPAHTHKNYIQYKYFHSEFFGGMWGTMFRSDNTKSRTLTSYVNSFIIENEK